MCYTTRIMGWWLFRSNEGHDSRAVANRLLEIAEEKGEEIPCLILMKLVYLAHVWHLGFRRKPLIRHEVRAWKHGPGIAEVYAEFRPPPPKDAMAPAKRSPKYRARLSKEEDKLIRDVHDAFGKLTPNQLAWLAAEPGSPWDTARKIGHLAPITHEMIERYYGGLVREELDERDHGKSPSPGGWANRFTAWCASVARAFLFFWPGKGHDSRAVANRLIEIAGEKGEEIPCLSLMKLVYLAHAWHMGFHHRPLIRHEARAWTYGPGIAEVYTEFRRLPPKDAMAPAKWSPKYRANFSRKEDKVIRDVYDAFGRLTPNQLAWLAAEPGSPWDTARKSGHLSLITNDMAERYYGSLAQERQGA